jgi:hypothetical protein
VLISGTPHSEGVYPTVENGLWVGHERQSLPRKLSLVKPTRAEHDEAAPGRFFWHSNGTPWERPADDGWLNGQWMDIAPESVASANSSSQYGWACATSIDVNLTCNYCTYQPPFFLNFHFMKLNSHLFSNWFLACYLVTLFKHMSLLLSSIWVFFLCIVFYFVIFFISIKCFKFEHHNPPHSEFFFDKKKDPFSPNGHNRGNVVDQPLLRFHSKIQYTFLGS